MAPAPEHATKRYAACEGIKYMNTRQNVRRRVYLMQILDHPNKDAVRVACHTKVKPIEG